MKSLPTGWPFPVSTDQREAAITGESTGLIDNVTMPRKPSAGRLSPKRALDDIEDAPY
jgi:hypothetical protein